MSIKLIQADALDYCHDHIRSGTVDLVIADPPFNIGYKYDEYEDDKTAKHYLEWSSKWIGTMGRILKPKGTMWVCMGDKFAAEVCCLAKNQGFYLRSWVIWYFTFGVNGTKNFTPSHTHLFYFTKHRTDFTFNVPDIKVPSARELIYNDKRAKKGGRLPDNTWILRPQNAEGEGALSSGEATWHNPRVAGTFKERAGYHGCQMPEAIMARIIKACTNKGDLVVDPFAGSCVSMFVAKKLGRDGIGIDISQNYITQGKRKLEKVKLGDAILGGDYYASK